MRIGGSVNFADRVKSTCAFYINVSGFSKICLFSYAFEGQPRPNALVMIYKDKANNC